MLEHFIQITNGNASSYPPTLIGLTNKGRLFSGRMLSMNPTSEPGEPRRIKVQWEEIELPAHQDP
jgi:hypothetical protein